jgi:polyphosphate kinase
MPRNLDRRVEVLFPVTDPSIKKALLSVVLDTELRDNHQLRLMKSDGTYERKHPAPGEEPVDSQSWFLDHKGIWYHVGA